MISSSRTPAVIFADENADLASMSTAKKPGGLGGNKKSFGLQNLQKIQFSESTPQKAGLQLSNNNGNKSTRKALGDLSSSQVNSRTPAATTIITTTIKTGQSKTGFNENNNTYNPNSVQQKVPSKSGLVVKAGSCEVSCGFQDADSDIDPVNFTNLIFRS